MAKKKAAARRKQATVAKRAPKDQADDAESPAPVAKRALNEHAAGAESQAPEETPVSREQPADVGDQAPEAAPPLTEATAPAAADPQVDQLANLANELVEAAKQLVVNRSRSANVDRSVAAVDAATQAILVASAAGPQSGEDHGCGCPGCGCVSDACCTFEIWMTHMRVNAMQFPLDSLGADTIGNMEVRLHVTVAGYGVVIPNMFSWIRIRKSLFQPSIWLRYPYLIGEIQVCKDQPRTVPIDIFAQEGEVGGEGLIPGNRDEYGMASGSVTLDCCVCDIDIPAIDLDFTGAVPGGGLGGGQISMRFQATKKCC